MPMLLPVLSNTLAQGGNIERMIVIVVQKQCGRDPVLNAITRAQASKIGAVVVDEYWG